MDTYALFCNGELAMAKKFFSPPQVRDFGVGEIPTSCYDIVTVEIKTASSGFSHLFIPATIEVGSKGISINSIEQNQFIP